MLFYSYSLFKIPFFSSAFLRPRQPRSGVSILLYNDIAKATIG